MNVDHTSTNGFRAIIPITGMKSLYYPESPAGKRTIFFDKGV